MKTLEENPNKLTANDLSLGYPHKLLEGVVAKLDGLDPTGFSERRVFRKAHTLSGLVRDVAGGNYPHLSMLAYAETVVALLKFIEVDDEVRDTLTGGLDDDMRCMTEVCSTHRIEIERYLKWRRAHL